VRVPGWTEIRVEQPRANRPRPSTDEPRHRSRQLEKWCRGGRGSARRAGQTGPACLGSVW
jgi:hypothetical protein